MLSRGLFVIRHFARLQSDPEIPVSRSRDDHAGHQEHVVDRVHHVGRSAAPVDVHCGADLAGEKVVICPGYESRPVDQGLHLRGHVGKIGRRAQNDRVGFDHFGDNRVYDVRIVGAAPVLRFPAVVAGQAATNLFSANLDQFCLDACLRNGLKHLLQQKFRVPAFARTSVDGNDFHFEEGPRLTRSIWDASRRK